LQAALLFYESKDLSGVQRMLKRCKNLLRDVHYTSEYSNAVPHGSVQRELTRVLAWQAEIAFATKDYWQARLLAMQWEILDGDNPNLEALKQDIVRVLGYYS
jgi:hypothetical protein